MLKIDNYKIKGIDKKTLLHVKGFKINPGDKYLISGISGSGKSTFLNHIAESRKELNLDSNIKFLYISQNPPLLLDENIYRNITGKLKSRKYIDEVNEIIKSTGIDMSKVNWKKKVSNYSGGEIQRIILAKIIFSKYDLILMDEPLSALDSKTKRLINDLYKKHLDESTVIYITHDNEEKKYLIKEQGFINFEIKDGELNGKKEN